MTYVADGDIDGAEIQVVTTAQIAQIDTRPDMSGEENEDPAAEVDDVGGAAETFDVRTKHSRSGEP
jgi:hypothetical protein